MLGSLITHLQEGQTDRTKMGKNLYLCNIPVSYVLTYIVHIPNLCFNERDMIHYENNQVKCYFFFAVMPFF